MSPTATVIDFFFQLAKTHALANRRFDNGLGGLGFNEFIILSALEKAEGSKMRRIDLAERIGLTASGVTRILLPMEKVGYVKKEINKDDARVSLVHLVPGGRRRLEEARSRMTEFIEEIFTRAETKKMKETTMLLEVLAQHLR